MGELPLDIWYMLLCRLVYDIGIYKSLQFRLVCSLFRITIEKIIFDLPTFESGIDQSPLHLQRDPRMAKALVARLIQQKTYVHNAHDRILCSSIRQTEELLAKFSIASEQCVQVLAASAARILLFAEIIKHLEVQVERYVENTLLENALIAATHMQQLSSVKTLVEYGAKPTTRTRFFGDAMTAAAQSGSEDILIYFLRINRNSSSIVPDTTELLSHVTALEAAAIMGHERIVSVLLTHAALLRPDMAFDTAVLSAVRAQHKSTALLLLQNRLPYTGEKEHAFWVNLLRTASENACDTVIAFIFNSSQINLDEENIALAVEDASQFGYVSTVRLLLSRLPNRIKLSGAAFLAAFHGRREVVNLLVNELGNTGDCLITDTLAGAVLNGQINLVYQVLQQVTGIVLRELPQFGNSWSEIYVSAIHFWLDSRQDSQGRRSLTAPSDDALWTSCEEGRIGEVRTWLSAFNLHRDLSSLCSAAASKNHPGLLLYLCQLVPPYLLPAVALESRSRAVIQVFLSLRWNVNEPLSRISPPILGHVLDDELLVRWLLEHGADPNARCDWDFTPMSRAVSRASLPLIRLLFERGGSVHHGQLIHFVLNREESDAKDVIDLLLELGASLHEIQYRNDPVSWAENKCLGLGTPLHGAIQLQRKDLVSYLLNKGADPTIADSLGRTAVGLADIVGCEEIIQLIQDNQNTA